MPEIDFPGHGPVRTLYLSILASPHNPYHLASADGAHDVFFFLADRRFRDASPIARVTFPIVLLSITRRGCFRVPQVVCVPRSGI